MKLNNRYLDESADDGLGSGGAGEPVEPDVVEPFIGDYTADDVLGQLSYVKELPEHLRSLESRVGAMVNPAMETMKGLQEKLGSQPGFDPKLEKVRQVLQEYDPALAEKLLPALTEDLKGSLSYTPLGPELLEPHISPMLQQQQAQISAQVVPALLDSLPFDADAVVNRDPANENNILEPSTDLQKDFEKWWQQADAATQQALSTYDVGYARAMHRFAKWRADRLKGKGEAAGATSARLSGSRPVRSGSQQQSAARKLETEDDGFNSVFAESK